MSKFTTMNKKKGLAVVLVSGGMDSALTAAYAAQKNELAFLHINYGQKTQKRELRAFNNIARYYKVKKKLVADISYLKDIGGSSLTDNKIKITKADLNNKSIPSSYVPFRNANILAIAVSWAEVLKAHSIYIGAVEEDSSGYPDCREKFFKEFEKMVSLGTKPGSGIKIVTPLINQSKKEIVLNSYKYKSPVHLSWSCYKNSNEACGICDSCALRLRGFAQAGMEDPIPYKIIPKYN